MEGFLWLLLQILPLLTAAAFVFFILGWRWRRQNGLSEYNSQDQKIDAQDILTQTAKRQLNAAHEVEEKLRQKLAAIQIELQESQARESQLQKEILRLADELKDSQPPDAPASLAEIPFVAPSESTPAKQVVKKAAKKVGKAKKRPSK